MAIYEIDIKNLDKLTKMVKELDSSLEALKKVNKEVKEIGRTSASTKKINTHLKNFNSQLNKINSNILKMFGIEEIEEHFKSIKNIGKNLWKSMTNDINGFIKTLGIVFTKLHYIMLIMGAITTVVSIFKTAFKFNIGGIQSTFRLLHAKFKKLQATMQILFFNYLKKLSPIFKAIGDALEQVMDVLSSPEVMQAFMVLADIFGKLMKTILPGLIFAVKLLANWISVLAKIINKVAKFLGITKNVTNNNITTNNDNRRINYYTARLAPSMLDLDYGLSQINRSA